MSEESFTVTMENGVFHLAGDLDERSDLSTIVSRGNPLSLDARDVKNISSVGARRWFRLLQSLEGVPIVLTGASPSFVNMLNSMPSALGENETQVEVRSVMTPYSCHTCNQYMEIECKPSITGAEFPVLPCNSCGIELASLVVPDDYLVFWRDRRPKKR